MRPSLLWPSFRKIGPRRNTSRLDPGWVKTSTPGSPTPPTATTMEHSCVPSYLRSRVSISSADTAVQPIIDPNSLIHPADIDVAVATFKSAREFWATDVMKKLVIGDEIYPGADVASDEEILELIRRSYNAM